MIEFIMIFLNKLNFPFHMLPNPSERKYNITFSCKFGNLLLLKMVSNKRFNVECNVIFINDIQIAIVLSNRIDITIYILNADFAFHNQILKILLNERQFTFLFALTLHTQFDENSVDSTKKYCICMIWWLFFQRRKCSATTYQQFLQKASATLRESQCIEICVGIPTPMVYLLPVIS